MENLYWIPHSTEIWALATYESGSFYRLEDPVDSATTDSKGTVLDLNDRQLQTIVTRLKGVSEICRQAIRSKNYHQIVLPVTDLSQLEGPDNICDLSDIHEASVLHSLRKRYLTDNIYSNIGRIVIALNPFTLIHGLYGSSVASKFQKAENPYSLPPHIYQVAAAAIKKLAESGIPQSTVITGESGAGKSESTKLVLQFLADVGSRSGISIARSASTVSSQGVEERSATRAFANLTSKKTLKQQLTAKKKWKDQNISSIEDRILRISPLLESFGNATTSRNPNSSRFGKWIEIYFDESVAVLGATITTYLLELPRVTKHTTGERGYHVFYQLLVALSGELNSMTEKYSLQPGSPSPGLYKYLTPDAASVPGYTEVLHANDVEGFRDLKNSMASLQFEPVLQDSLFSIVASLLHLGNVAFTFENSKTDVMAITMTTHSHMLKASELLQIDSSLIEKCMLFREVKTGSETIQVPLKETEAPAARDSLAKLIYGSLFSWILHKANLNLAPDSEVLKNSHRFVGILDIAGFESFVVNGFEQLCINLSNEKLQKQFNQDLFENELLAYKEEGLEGLDLSYEDNQGVLDLIEGARGIFDSLDEELFVPRGTDKGFVSKMLKNNSASKALIISKIQADERFTIRHFAGDVTYTVNAWLSKNQYNPPKLASEILRSSLNPVIQEMILVTDEERQGNETKRATVGSTFKRQLNALMAKISFTEVHYIRCIKPNKRLRPREVDSAEILHQLRSSGAMEAIKIRKAGFPIRMPIVTFLSRFGILMGRKASILKEEINKNGAAQKLIDHVCYGFGLSSNEMVIGRTRVFLRDKASQSLEQFRKLALAEPATKIQSVWRGYKVRQITKRAFELSRKLRPILGVGVQSAKQGGCFLYPVSVVQGVLTGAELSRYVDEAGVILDECDQLPKELQPSTLLKAREIFQQCRREADVVESCEKLLEERSLNLSKIGTVLDKATRFKIRNPSVDQLRLRLTKLEFEIAITPQIEKALNEENLELCEQLLERLASHLDTYGDQEFLVKLSRKLYVTLQDFVSSTHMAQAEDLEQAKSVRTAAEAETNAKPLLILESLYNTKDGEYDESVVEASIKPIANPSTTLKDISVESLETSSSSSEEWDELSDEDYTSTEEAETMATSFAKFTKELKMAISTFDAERLDLLIQRYQESGIGRRHNRGFVSAVQIRSNLDDPEWVTSEIKGNVVKVVWGTNDPQDVARLTNLMKRADILGLSGADVESGRKALQCLRAAPFSASDHHGEVNIISEGVYDFKNYEGLRINQKKKKKSIFSFSFFKGPKERRDFICCHTFDNLPTSLTLRETRQQNDEAIHLFRLIQGYMGDRPHIARDYIAEEIIKIGMERADIRDELYLQLMKQLRQNPRNSSESRGWSLMLYCCQNFIPSEPLQPYVRYFLLEKTGKAGAFYGGIFDELGDTAKQALKEFDKSVPQKGVRRKPIRPSLEQTTEDDNWNAEITVKLFDESRQKVSIKYHTTLGDVINEICRRLNMDETGWTIMILTDVNQGTLDIVLPVLDIVGFDLLTIKIVQSTLFALWGFPQFRIVSDSQRVWDIWDTVAEAFPPLIFRRRMISVSEMLYPHPNHAHLTYKQLLWEFSKYPVAEGLNIMAAIIARILVAEKWASHLSNTSSSTTNVPSAASAAAANNLTGYSEFPIIRTNYRAMAISYQLLEHAGYIPALYTTTNLNYRNEWEYRVRAIYETLDADEHQLLAINNVLMEMRRLSVFGGFSWLVVEPNDRIYDNLITGSQLRAAFEGSDVHCNGNALSQLLFTNVCVTYYHSDSAKSLSAYETDMLQPMIVTPKDVTRLKAELQMEGEEQEAKYSVNTDTHRNRSCIDWIKRYFHELRWMESESSSIQGEFAKGEAPIGDIQFPLWMSFNSAGLHFCPALSLADSNNTPVSRIRIPTNQVSTERTTLFMWRPLQIFAIETLWLYCSSEKAWLPVGIAACVDMKGCDSSNPINPRWTLISVIPLTSSVQSIITALKAFFPTLPCYGDVPVTMTNGANETTPDENEGGEIQGVETGIDSITTNAILEDDSNIRDVEATEAEYDELYEGEDDIDFDQNEINTLVESSY